MVLLHVYMMISVLSEAVFIYLSLSWSYGSWIYNYPCNQCLSPLMLWIRISLRRGVLNTTLCDKVFPWLATGQWFSTVTLVSSTNKNDRHDITEILLKVALKTITTTMYWSETELEVNTADCWPVTRPIQNYHLIISLFINYWLRIGFFWFFFCFIGSAIWADGSSVFIVTCHLKSGDIPDTFIGQIGTRPICTKNILAEH